MAAAKNGRPVILDNIHAARPDAASNHPKLHRSAVSVGQAQNAQSAQSSSDRMWTGPHRAGRLQVLGSLQRLLEDGEVELPDGTLLKTAARLHPAAAFGAAATTDGCRPAVVEIQPGFRVLAIGTQSDR